jgi:hypothetical protein
VYVHHFTQYIDGSIFDEAYNNATDLIHQYEEFEQVKEPEKIPRLKPLI